MTNPCGSSKLVPRWAWRTKNLHQEQKMASEETLIWWIMMVASHAVTTY
jgi:hypothetical protein